MLYMIYYIYSVVIIGQGGINMKVDDFLRLMQKVMRFKIRLEQEGIRDSKQQIILKIYINDITDRINTSLLEVI